MVLCLPTVLVALIFGTLVFILDVLAADDIVGGQYPLICGNTISKGFQRPSNKQGIHDQRFYDDVRAVLLFEIVLEVHTLCLFQCRSTCNLLALHRHRCGRQIRQTLQTPAMRLTCRTSSLVCGATMCSGMRLKGPVSCPPRCPFLAIRATSRLTTGPLWNKSQYQHLAFPSCPSK